MTFLYLAAFPLTHKPALRFTKYDLQQILNN